MNCLGYPAEEFDVNDYGINTYELLRIAIGEPGYEEKASSYSAYIAGRPDRKTMYPDEDSYYDDPTVNAGKWNWTKYGKYTGANGNTTGDSDSFAGAWCVSFISWCANRANIPDCLIPNKEKSTSNMKSWYIGQNRYKAASSGYIPREGDLVFYTAHTAIVVYADKDGYYSIDGNSDDTVKYKGKKSYTAPVGFGINGSSSYGKMPPIADNVNGSTR